MSPEDLDEVARSHNIAVEVLSPEATDDFRRVIYDAYEPFDTAHGIYNEERAGTPYLAEDFVNFHGGAQSYMTFGQPHVTINYSLNPFYLLADFFNQYPHDKFIVFYPKHTTPQGYKFPSGEHVYKMLADTYSWSYDVFITNTACDFLLLWANEYDVSGLSALGKARAWLLNILYDLHRRIGMPIDVLVAKQFAVDSHPIVHTYFRDMLLYVLDIQPPDEAGTLSIQFAYDEAQNRKIARVNFTACNVQNWLTYMQPRGRPGVFLAHLQLPQQSGQIIPAKIWCDLFKIEFTYDALFVEAVALS
jgi:hypothetical protein